MDVDLISFMAGMFLGGGIGAILFFFGRSMMKERISSNENDRKNLENEFSVIAQKALTQSNEAFLQLANEKLKAAHGENSHDLEKRQKAISDMVDPISKTLKEMEERIENMGKAEAGIKTQLQTFAEDQRLLRKETQNLVRTLRNPATRGRWGEMQFQRALDMIGFVEGTHYCTQQQSVSNDGTSRRPDFIISLPGDLKIIIDVKAPIEPYWEAVEASHSESERDKALNSFRHNIREHIKSLSSKEYWRNVDGSPSFVVMFLPTEGLYSLAVSSDHSLLEDAARHDIIIASPTTVMGLLRVAMYGWQQQAVAEEAKHVSELAGELYRRISVFGNHMQKMGKNLSSAISAYNNAVGSLESSVLPGARRFKELHIQTGSKEIPDLQQIDSSIRNISADELCSGGADDKDLLTGT